MGVGGVWSERRSSNQSPCTPMELFTWPFYNYLLAILFLLVVVSFMVNHFLSDAMMLIKLRKRVGVDEELAV